MNGKRTLCVTLARYDVGVARNLMMRTNDMSASKDYPLRTNWDSAFQG